MVHIVSRHNVETQRKQLNLLLLVRLLVGLACLIAHVLSQRGSAIPLSGHAAGLLLLGCALSVIYFSAAKRIDRPGVLTFCVLFGDIALITALIHLTGGNQSNYSYLYFAIIVSASILVSGKASLLFASTATVCLSGITLARLLANHYQQGLPFTEAESIGRASQNLSFALGYLLAQGLALHLVALLSGSLATRIGRLSSLTDSILKHMASGVIVSDLNGRLQYLNDAARDMLGFDERAKLIGQSIGQTFRRKGDLPLRNTLQKFEETERDFCFPRKKGDLYVEMKTRVLKDPKGREVGIIALLTDLTEKRQMIEARRQAETLAGIEEMAAGIAHEIRNPLASMRGSVQELGHVECLDEDQQDLLKIILTESDRLDRIISDFLQFTRMRPTEPVSCDLSDVLSDVVTLMEKQTGTRTPQITVEGKFPKHLPCTGDREQLKQLLLNLAINGLEAMEKGGLLTVEAGRLAAPTSTWDETQDRRMVASGSGGVQLRVSDTGEGIAKEAVDHLFTPFFTTKKNGTGMGLSVVQKIVSAHGGAVYVDHNVAGGTTFTIWIPDRPNKESAILEENPTQEEGPLILAEQQDENRFIASLEKTHRGE